MYQIDKAQFGTFVAQLRREKCLTQKELAQTLCVSDKAVSKWETGITIPDIQLLIPLSEQLGVSVTDLLLCRRSESPMPPEQTEEAVRTALNFSKVPVRRAWQEKTPWKLWYLLSLVIAAAAMAAEFYLGIGTETLLVSVLLGGVFGGYVCLWAPVRLPDLYDKTRCNLLCDGFFRMNVPGVTFCNRNWPHILRGLRIWACLAMTVLPVGDLALGYLIPEHWRVIGPFVCLSLLLGGLFLPVYILGRKYR